MIQDLKFAFRILRKNPSFTAIVVIILALGIGFNSAIFSIVYEVLLKSLPYRDPDRLVVLSQSCPKLFGNEKVQNSVPAVKDWQTQDKVFENAGGFMCVPTDVIADGVPERVTFGAYTKGFFPTIGVSPILGRLLTDEESTPFRAPLALLSYEYWQSRFRARQDVLGKPITVGTPYTIVGVLPRSFRAFELSSGFRSAEIWIPLSVPDQYLHRGNTFLVGVARLKPSVSLQTAQANLAFLDKVNAQQFPQYCDGWNTVVEKMHDSITGHLSKTLIILLGAVGFVLLITCANVANLLLARAAEREREMAIRISMGAEKGRLIRLLLMESLLLSLSGGVAGLLVASASIDLINALFAGADLGIPSIHLEVQVVGYIFAVAVLTGLIFGLIPALETLRVDFNTALKSAGRGMSATPFRQKLKGMLIIFEMGVSLMLLIAAGLLIRNFVEIWKTDPGFKPDHVLTMEISRPGAWFDFKRVEFYQPLLDRVVNMPAVTACGLASNVPGQGSKSCSFSIEGRPVPREGSQTPTEMLINVTPQYFKVLGIPLKRGQPFSELDNAKAPKVVLINDALAKKYWGDQDPLGKRISYEGSWATIIGIVGNIRQKGLIEKAEPIVYVPYYQYPIAPVSLLVRFQADPSLLAATIRQEVLRLDQTQVVADVSTLNGVLLTTMAPQQLVMYLIGAFAVLALLLAASGIYGVISYYVAMHTQEVGIRMALGGDPKDILKLIIGKGLKLILTGTGLGVLASFALTRLLSSLLHGVSPTDPLTFSGVTLFLIAVALLACFIPARRVSLIDPIVALRCE
jgi:predicted permease